jgi:prepilin-type N-terminal cleavage/methylation domain-containing protein
MKRIRPTKKRRRHNAGFTLVEILIVIVIIGILAGLAVPKFMHAATKAKQTEAKQMLRQIYTLERAYRIENDEYWIPPTGTVAGADAVDAFAELGLELMPQARYEYSITGDQDHFEARAVARRLDDDDTIDEWMIDQIGKLEVITNDATN